MLKDRNALAALATGIGAELGVAAGAYSATLLECRKLSRLYSIDRWADHHDESEYAKACKRLGVFGARSVVVRATFAEAVKRFPDASLDWVYIDGYAHTGQEGGQTLRDWWPKLKPGGLFAGHDYDAVLFPQTVAAVDAFVAEYGLQLELTGEERMPSWFVRKPYDPALRLLLYP